MCWFPQDGRLYQLHLDLGNRHQGQRGHLEFGLALEDYTERLKRLFWLEIAPVTAKNWIDNLNLDWEHRDPADRTIVALAKARNLQLLSKDQAIRDFYPLTVC